MVSQRARLWAGALCVLGFVILSDGRDIYLERHIKVDNPFDYLLLVFSMTALFYAGVNAVKTMREPHPKASGFLRNIVWLNIVTASNWLGWYLALKYLTAPTVVALYAGIIPMATLVVNRCLRSTSVTSIADWISTALLLACATAWALANTLSLQGSEAAVGLGLVVICSVSIAATTVVSKRLADARVPASRIMAHRFYVLLAISLYMSSPAAELLDLARRNFQLLMFAATVGTILSLWLLQKGIERCEPVLTVVIIATSPAFSLALYYFLIGSASLEVDTVVMSIAVVLIAVFHTLFQHRHPSHRSFKA
jgi:drug/metabolite transporter (DMT)-like permease